ncbi:hypothetical protein QBC34DRAFT_467768 [Podospora aff. communis PSN243]|uniref:Uncharacterized protein n=1 Tax=Podospora aff. communis PSN243 TaxID=3040156 RepID=A0AAV9GG77_9PEZI|nr:hypothetical protein QBC34DRAFT_467768 [Podospora aff. communis PSN243]
MAMAAGVDFMALPMVSDTNNSAIGAALVWMLFAALLGLRVIGTKLEREVEIGVGGVLAVVAFLLSGSTIGFNATSTIPSPPDVLAGLTAAVFVSGLGYDFAPLFPGRRWEGQAPRAKEKMDAMTEQDESGSEELAGVIRCKSETSKTSPNPTVPETSHGHRGSTDRAQI